MRLAPLLFVLVIASRAGLARSQPPSPPDDRPLGASRAEVDPMRGPTPPQPAQQVPTEADRVRRARVVARIGTVQITVGQVEDDIARQSPFMRARYRDPAQLRELVQNMIRFELLAREAERQHFGDDPEVREATAQSAVQLLIRERFDEVITPDSIPAEDVRAYYEAHPDEFSRPEMRRASHILVATRARAAELRQQAGEADARTFRGLAQEHSLDAESRARGGDLRYFDAEGRSPNASEAPVEAAIVRAAFALHEVGEVSEPIEVGGQWTIVKLTGRRPAEHRSIEEAAASIRLRLWRERRQRALDEAVERLRTASSLEVHYDRMRAIRLEEPERISEDDDHASDEGPEESEAPTLPGSRLDRPDPGASETHP